MRHFSFHRTCCRQVRYAAEGDSPEAQAVQQAAPAAIAAGEGSSVLAVSARHLTRIAEARQVLEEGADSWLAGPLGVLSFLFSVLSSRTVSAVREDMDDSTTPLIGRFGHCSQELVNLMLIGEATSKLGSRADSQLSEEAKLDQQVKKVFVENSIDEGGLAMSANLSKMLGAVGIDGKKLQEAQQDIVREDVILWEDFRLWVGKQFNVAAADTKSGKIQLFLYDGQESQDCKAAA
eukprot:g15441.t1